MPNSLGGDGGVGGMAIAPSSLQDVILLHIPKPGKLLPGGECSCTDLRPLTIFSVRWGAWSENPRLASICDHELSRLGYGVTLDFRSCFDTIDLPLITEALMASLPSGLLGWINLLLSRWIKVNKWIRCNGRILGTPLNGHTGIPQGDAVSSHIKLLFVAGL